MRKTSSGKLLVKGLSNADAAFRWIGKMLGAGRKASDNIQSIKRVAKGTGAFQDPYLRPGIRAYAEDILKQRAARKTAERIAGYTAGFGVPIVGGGITYAALSGSGDSNTDEAVATNPLAAISQGSTEAATSTPSIATEAPDNGDRAEGSSFWRNLGLYGAATATGATAGYFLDRRNRLRGMLIGGIVTPAVTAAIDYAAQSGKRNA